MRAGPAVLVAVVPRGVHDDAGTQTPVVDAGASSSSSLVDPTVLERGEYLVRSVAGLR